MKKIQAFIIVMLICIGTGLFSVTGWASPVPSNQYCRDENADKAGAKGQNVSSGSGPSVCIPPDAHYSKGHYYKRYDMDYTWTEAREYCDSQGGHLMTITSEEEQEILRNLGLESRTNYWIGGTDSKIEGRWKWVTGEKWSFTQWKSGEPNNHQRGTGIEEDYLQVCTDEDYAWNDSADEQDYTAGIGFICEWEPNSNAQEEKEDVEGMGLIEGLLTIFQF